MQRGKLEVIEGNAIDYLDCMALHYDTSGLVIAPPLPDEFQTL